MPQEFDYLTIDLSPLDPAEFWPRPLVLVARLGKCGSVRVSSTLHRLLGAEGLPMAQPDLFLNPLVVERDSLIAPWPPEPPLPNLYREVRLVVLHVLYPKPLAARLHELGQLGADQLAQAPEGEVPHEREVAIVWSTFWEAVEPQLDSDALALAANVGGDLTIYNILAKHPASRDLVRMAPILATLLDPDVPIGLQRGRRVRDTIGDLAKLASERNPMSPAPRLPLSAGFMEWLSRVPMSPACMPRVRSPRSLRHLVLTLASAGDAFSPSWVRRLHSDMQWYMVHSAGIFLGTIGVLAAMRDPDAAMRAIDRDYGLAEQPDFVRKCGHFRRCLDLAALAFQRPEAYRRARSFRRILELGREWEAMGDVARARESAERLNRELEAARTAPQSYPAPPFHWESTTGPQSPWHLVYLDTDLAVLEDALVMHTCLAGYRRMCERSTAYLFSIRNADGKRVATLHASPAGEVRELRGPRNKQMPEKLRSWVVATLDQSRGT
jgi:hypothetical protein